jgi:hypothetical protein
MSLSTIPSLRPDRQAYKAEDITWLENNQALGELWAKTLVFRICAQRSLHYPKYCFKITNAMFGGNSQ